MRALHYLATAEVPQIAHALGLQSLNTLRPFDRFLRQAIHTAKARQSRYQLPWSLAAHERSYRVTPLDTCVRVARQRPSVVLSGWQPGTPPNLVSPAFSVTRSVGFQVLEAREVEAGLQVVTDTALQVNEQVAWCGQICSAQAVVVGEAPERVASEDGTPWVLLRPATADGDEHWRLVIEGRHEIGLLQVDGAIVEAWPGVDTPEEGATSQVLTDAAGVRLSTTRDQFRATQPPAKGVLIDALGVRYSWREVNDHTKGVWLQLESPPDASADDTFDPRAAFCEGDVSEVWTAKFRSENSTFKVKKVNADAYQILLEKLPPEGSTLYLPVDLNALYLQQRALRQLNEAPLPHMRGLLRLCEAPDRVLWPQVRPVAIAEDEWCALKDASRSGTDAQRDFVSRALGTPDLAILEGPPGSGKTTAICELVQQFLLDGQRVLLCASTNAAIDNVLERLLAAEVPVDAVRVGKMDKLDPIVAATQLDERVDALVARWRTLPAFAQLDTRPLQEMAVRTVVMGANLTCGTTIGIARHPLFKGRDTDLQSWQRPIATLPHWDVLIVDEASKTLIQEFMVPALMARRWIIVGDVRQLPPFADRADLVANLRDLVTHDDTPIFEPAHQRACLLRFRLRRHHLNQPGLRWLVCEANDVLTHLEAELNARPEVDVPTVRITRKGAPAGVDPPAVKRVSVTDLLAGKPEALWLLCCRLVLVDEDLLAEVSSHLPGDLLSVRALTSGVSPLLEETSSFVYRQAHRYAHQPQVARPYKDRGARRQEVSDVLEAEAIEQDWLSRNDVATELAWRLTRRHELRHSQSRQESERLSRDLEQLRPKTAHIDDALAEIEDIGLPSILSVIQEGIGAKRANRSSALTEGLPKRNPEAFAARFGSLNHQHRMHPDISAFARDTFYQGQSLHDANTIAQRDARLGWDFGPFPARRAWAQVDGHEHGGVNGEEVRCVERVLNAFLRWARQKGPPRGQPGARWEVACLAFYNSQVKALAQMLRSLTGDNRSTRFAPTDAPVEIVCGTVDRFQGREADLVLLSLRNTRRVGFLDSPNRLNVALTRARHQLIVAGNAEYFGRCGTSELEKLVRGTPTFGSDVFRTERG